MASPQIENGHTQIANELLEAFSKIRISGEENQVFWFIVRKTYGFKKKEDAISLSQFVLGTGLPKPNVCRALSKLITKNLIIKNDNKRITTYRIQKDYTTWLPLSKLITLSKMIKPVIKTDNKSVIKKDTHKRNKNTKETLTKTYGQDELDRMFEKWWKRYPKKVDVSEAKRKWLINVVTNGIDPQKLEDALTGYINVLINQETDIEYVKHGKTFLYPGNKKKNILPTWKQYVQFADPKYKHRPSL